MDCARVFRIAVLGSREFHWKWENRLRGDHTQVTYSTDPQAICDYLAQHPVDIVVVDSKDMTPQTELAICKQIRAQSDVPVLLLTAINDEDHLVAAYENGIDDHLVQEVSPSLILAKLLAWLRWTESPNTSASNQTKTILA